jgi:hypothetical protein
VIKATTFRVEYILCDFEAKFINIDKEVCHTPLDYWTHSLSIIKSFQQEINLTICSCVKASNWTWKLEL